MRIAGMVGIGMDIDILGFQFGIENGLAGVQAVIAGEHIADAAGQRIAQQTPTPQQNPPGFPS